MLVSVVMRTCNRAVILPRAVRCVLNQTFPTLELIIVDDCSEDNTRDVIRHFQCTDDRIVPVLRTNREETGDFRVQAINAGLAAARGDYICYLDDDNLWNKHYIEKMVTALGKESQLHLAYCDTADHGSPEEIEESIKRDERQISWRTPTSVVFPHLGNFSKLEIFESGNCYRDYLDTNEIMHTREALSAVGGIWKEADTETIARLRRVQRCYYRVYEDLEFVERVIALFGTSSTVYLPEVLVHHLSYSHPLYQASSVRVNSKGELRSKCLKLEEEACARYSGVPGE